MTIVLAVAVLAALHTPLIYWPAGDDHACQGVKCRYRHGMRNAGPARPVSSWETSS